MELSKKLQSLDTINKDNYLVKVTKTGKLYEYEPTSSYKNDVFLIWDRKKAIQYEIYAINVKGEYKVTEILRVKDDNFLSSLQDEKAYEELSVEILKLLEKE
ncbi:hypothetical protein GYA44_00945 [Candidatus Microgenomates bacterium]|nr:hypothetical protein [Candidatus Microgenomates bacterium]